MKYILTRISILILGLVIIFSISYYVEIKAREEIGGIYANAGGGCFTVLIFILAIASLSVFSYEACQFNKQSKIEERNRSFVLIFPILVFLIVSRETFMHEIFNYLENVKQVYFANTDPN
jgi:hypothetical protein